MPQFEEYHARKVFITFWDAVTLGFGIAVGMLIAYFVIALAVGVVYGIMLAVQGD